MLGIATALASAGLNLLSDVIREKGKDFIEKKFNVKIPDTPDQLDQETLLKLKELELKHEEELQRILLEQRQQELDYLKTVDQETTKRWVSDNTAGMVTKLVRPLTLIYLLIIFSLMAFTDSNVLHINQMYAQSFSDFLKMAILAYFGLRTFEKVKGAAQ
ncbi:hypothetical protein [Desulfurobacterium sp.]